MKQDSLRRNDPMSILNQLKKFKTKGKTKTPRPTQQVKSSRVESTTAFLFRRDAPSVSSLSRERQKQRQSYGDRQQSHNKMKKTRMQSQKHIHPSQQRKTISSKYVDQSFDVNMNQNVNFKPQKQLFNYEGKFKPLIQIFQGFDKQGSARLNMQQYSSHNKNASKLQSNLQQCIFQIQGRIKTFDDYQNLRKQKKAFDQFDYWLNKFMNAVKNMLSQAFVTIIEQTQNKTSFIMQAVQKMENQRLIEIESIREKYLLDKQRIIQRINSLTQKNVFANDIIARLSSEELDVQYWVKKNVFGVQDSSTYTESYQTQQLEQFVRKKQNRQSDGLSSKTEVKNIKSKILKAQEECLKLNKDQSREMLNESAQLKEKQFKFIGKIPITAFKKGFIQKNNIDSDKNSNSQSQYTVKNGGKNLTQGKDSTDSNLKYQNYSSQTQGNSNSKLHSNGKLNINMANNLKLNTDKKQNNMKNVNKQDTRKSGSKHKYHHSDLTGTYAPSQIREDRPQVALRNFYMEHGFTNENENQMIHIQQDESYEGQEMEESWDRFY